MSSLILRCPVLHFGQMGQAGQVARRHVAEPFFAA